MMRDNPSQTQEQILEIPMLKALSLATRSQHAQLNHLILSHLPLALPPYTVSSEPYAQGLLQFAAIYHAFESSWQILSDYEPASELPLETAVVLSSLIHLSIPALPRTERLLDDLSLLLDLPRSDIAARIRDPQAKATRAFVAHIRETARNKPHALIAYAWVLYMALFNGGRWIREQLATARDLAWSQTDSRLQAAGSEAGLRFWYFDSGDDGDDIKNEFKTRLTDVGAMLSTAHKEDIIDEAKMIFERCAEMVLELDQESKQNNAIQQEQQQQCEEVARVRWSGLTDVLSMLLPLVVMQVLMLIVRRISGARIRAPLPFRKLDRKDD